MISQYYWLYCQPNQMPLFSSLSEEFLHRTFHTRLQCVSSECVRLISLLCYSLLPRAHRLPLEQHNCSDTNIRLALLTSIVCCRHMSADDTSFSLQHTQLSLSSPFPSASLFPYASISFVSLRGCVWFSLSSSVIFLSLTHSINWWSF